MNRCEIHLRKDINMECRVCREKSTMDLRRTIDKDALIERYMNGLGVDVSSYLVQDVKLFRCNSCGALLFYPSTPGRQEFYEQLQHFDWYYMDDKWEYRQASNYIKKSANVLELGAGKGAFSKFLPDNVTYRGLEYSSTAVTIAAANGVNIINELIEDYAVHHEQEYDVVCHFQVLEHVDDVYSFMSNSCKCLVQGGLYLICVPNEESYLHFLPHDTLNLPPHHLSRWDRKAILGLGRVFGLELIDLEYEPLAEIHLTSYIDTLVEMAIGMPQPGEVPDRKTSERDMRYLLRRFMEGCWLKRAWKHEVMRPRGHSLLAVYRKI